MCDEIRITAVQQMLTIRQSDRYVRFCEVTMFLQSKIYTRVVTDRILAKYLEPIFTKSEHDYKHIIKNSVQPITTAPKVYN